MSQVLGGCECRELIGKGEEAQRAEWTETRAMKRPSKVFVIQSGALEKLRLHSERRTLGRWLAFSFYRW